MDYPLCTQTVTVYRYDRGILARRVAPGCFYRWEDRCRQDSKGVQSERRFLLIQPGEEPIYPGDRIYAGEGPVITAGEWADFTPENVPGLSVAAYARPWQVNGETVHYEAGN